MSAKRVTVFTCDNCGRERLSPDNYSMPEGWEYENPAGEEPTHTCGVCTNGGPDVLVVRDREEQAMKALAAQRSI